MLHQEVGICFRIKENGWLDRTASIKALEMSMEKKRL